MKQARTTFDAAPLDRYAEQITTGVAMLGGLLLLPLLFLYLSGLLFEGVNLIGVLIPVAVAAALFVWLLLSYAVQPIRYDIEDKALLVRRHWSRPMRVPFKEIIAVSPANALADVPRFGLRRSFNAGIFGYQGPFRLEPYGAVFFMATHRERLVALARPNLPPLILSPARPADFIEELRAALTRFHSLPLEEPAAPTTPATD
jgi:hypothetical protein